MALRQLLEEVAAGRKTVTVFAPERYDALESYFETRNIAVEHEDLPDDGSGGFVVVSEGGDFLGSIGADAVAELVSPSKTTFGTDRSEATEVLFDLLADTAFVSLDKRQMVATAREIEDRAYRRGRGTLRTGFQSLSAMRAQREVYEALAEEPDLDVHVYGRPDWSPDVPGATVHAEDAPEIGAFWFVAFDGGGDDRQASALLAEERAPDSDTFRGVWTYDAEQVADIDDYLRDTYG